MDAARPRINYWSELQGFCHAGSRRIVQDNNCLLSKWQLSCQPILFLFLSCCSENHLAIAFVCSKTIASFFSILIQYAVTLSTRSALIKSCSIQCRQACSSHRSPSMISLHFSASNVPLQNRQLTAPDCFKRGKGRSQRWEAPGGL